MKKLLFILLTTFLCSCDNYIGCGTIYSKTIELNDNKLEYYVWFKGEDGKSHKCYVTYFRFEELKEGDVICAE